MLSQNPSVIVKRKNIQSVIDYCLDNRIESKMFPRDMPEEWEMEFAVSDIMKAINLGMFLKENKLDLIGFGSPTSLNSAKPNVKVAKVKKEKETKTDSTGIFTSTSPENIFNAAPTSAVVDEDSLPL